MIARFVQDGLAINYRPAEAVAAGEVIVLGSLVGIARLDIAADTLGALATVGVFEIDKAAEAVTLGAVLYWDATAKKVTATGTGNVYIGKAVTAAEATDEKVCVLLNAPYVAPAAE